MTELQRFSTAEAPKTADELVFLAPEQIRLPERGRRNPPRAEQNCIIRLSASVRRYGILDPLCVRPAADENGFPCYELTDGERRLRAARLCGLSRVPCRVVRPDAAETAKQTLIDRLCAGKTDFFTEAQAFSSLMSTYHMTQEEIARRLALSQSAVANKIRLLQFSPAEREQILRAGLSERHARALLRVRDMGQRRTLLDAVIRGALTVGATEALIDRFAASKQTPHTASASAPAPVSPAADKSAPESGERADGGEQTVGVRKFAVRDLRPLYNSIDRTLEIFRKTGAQTNCTHRETADGAEIVIRILRQS